MRTIRSSILAIATIAIGTLAVGPAIAAGPSQGAGPAMTAAWVTGTLIPASDCTGDPATFEGSVERYRGGACAGQTFVMSDPRLSGTSDATFSVDIHHVPGGSFAVGATRYELRNEGGGWTCRSMDAIDDPAAMGSDAETAVCVGTGGYAGLSAILVLDWTACVPAFTQCLDSPVQVKGAIVTGDLPPQP